MAIKTYGDAFSAVRAIGTNGLPTIRRMLRAHDGAVRRGMITLVNSLKFLRVHLRTDDEKVIAALKAIEILGGDAQALLPDLIRLAQNPDVKFRTHGMNGLLDLLLHDFGGIPPRNPALVSLLLDRVRDPDDGVVSLAWQAVRLLEASDRKVILEDYQAGPGHLSATATNAQMITK